MTSQSWKDEVHKPPDSIHRLHFLLYVNTLLWLISYQNSDWISLILNYLLWWSTDWFLKLSSWMDFRVERVSYVLGGLWRSHPLHTSPGGASFCVWKKKFYFLKFLWKSPNSSLKSISLRILVFSWRNRF